MPLWKPTDLLNDSASLWLSSERLSEDTTKWKDSSGKGNTAVTGTVPTRSVRAKNNKDTFVFAKASNKHLLVESHSGPEGLPLDVGTGDFYMGAFIKVPTVASLNDDAPQSVLSKDATGSAFDFRVNGSEHIIMSSSSGPDSHSSGTVLTNEGYFWIYCFRSGSGSNNMTVGHSDSAVANNFTLFTNTDNMTEASEFIVGARQATGDGSIEKGWDGEIAEVLVFHKCPTAAEIDIIEGYIHHKYGETGKLDSAHPYKTANVDLTSCHCMTETSLSTKNFNSSVMTPYELNTPLNVYDRERK